MYVHWVDVTGGLVFCSLVAYIVSSSGTVAKASFNMHAYVWPNHYWFM